MTAADTINNVQAIQIALREGAEIMFDDVAQSPYFRYTDMATGIVHEVWFEDARSVLPNACDTKIVMTMNVRSLYNFFNLRCCTRAQWEIRALADEMLCKVKQVAPTLFRKAGPPCVSGPCPEGKMSCGRAQEIRAKFENM